MSNETFDPLDDSFLPDTKTRAVPARYRWLNNSALWLEPGSFDRFPKVAGELCEIRQTIRELIDLYHEYKGKKSLIYIPLEEAPRQIGTFAGDFAKKDNSEKLTILREKLENESWLSNQIMELLRNCQVR